MKACYLDANVLVYFQDQRSPFHKKSVSLVENLSRQEVFPAVSPLVLDEFLYTLKSDLRRQKLPREKVYLLLKQNLKEILSLIDLILVSSPADSESQVEVIELMSQHNLNPRDAYHLLTMRSNGIEFFATFDKDFDRVFRGKVVRQFAV